MAICEVALVVGLVVRLHHLIARVPRDPVHPERADVEVAADEIEESIRVGRVVGIEVLRPNNVGKQDGPERCAAWISHAATFASRQAKINAPVRPVARALRVRAPSAASTTYPWHEPRRSPRAPVPPALAVEVERHLPALLAHTR